MTSHTDWRDSRRPRLLRNTARRSGVPLARPSSVPRPSARYRRSARHAYSPSGTSRCLDPLPVSRATCASSMSMSSRFIPTASETRHPVAYMNSSSALSRSSTASGNAPMPALPRAASVPCGSGIASSRRETSSIVSTSGSICALLGALTVADTSSLTACCARANRWNSWMLASLLALLRALSPSESSCATYSSMSALPMASGSVMPRVCASHER